MPDGRAILPTVIIKLLGCQGAPDLMAPLSIHSDPWIPYSIPFTHILDVCADVLNEPLKNACVTKSCSCSMIALSSCSSGFGENHGHGRTAHSLSHS